MKTNMHHIIILASGKGTRMNVDYRKMIHKINKIPLISHLLPNSIKIRSARTFILRYWNERVVRAMLHRYDYLRQSKQLDAGDALYVMADILSHKKNQTNTVYYTYFSLQLSLECFYNFFI